MYPGAAERVSKCVCVCGGGGTNEKRGTYKGKSQIENILCLVIGIYLYIVNTLSMMISMFVSLFIMVQDTARASYFAVGYNGLNIYLRPMEVIEQKI